MEKGLSNILLQYHSDRREDSGRGIGLSMSNALQVVTEALASSTKLPPFCQIEIKRDDNTTTTYNDTRPPMTTPTTSTTMTTSATPLTNMTMLDRDDIDDDDDDDNDDIDDEEIIQTTQQAFQTVTLQQQQQQQHHQMVQPHAGLIGKTIVASDNDVTNGFVKDGKMLPYVFEATESGVRKRSSKILPVCGVCGKRFVCVTTMKRHLVTHTGEKPFSCKVCGKQYTQKGNLRVHERTHRNDRPFECNICHQKFYRKEPMQKHQWRQHGVVHFKSRPLPGVGGNEAATVTATSSSGAPVSNISSSGNNNEGIMFNSLTDQMPQQLQQQQHQQQQETVVEKPPNCYVRPLSDIVVAAAASSSPLPPVAHLLSAPVTMPAGRDSSVEQVAKSLPAGEIIYRLPESSAHRTIRQPMLQSALTLQKSTSFNCIPANTIQEPVPEATEKPSEMVQAAVTHSSPKPIKLRMKFAYQKEQEDHNSTGSSISSNSNCSSADVIKESDANFDEDFEGIPKNLGELKLRSSSASPSEQTDTRGSSSVADPFQCIGCCVVFAHKPALKAHQICPEDRERPFRCCKCGYKFRQKAHLQKHQWRIHRRRYCDQDDATPATTITMQDIINHGVEKSLREIPVYHGKTSSKYYSEVLGLEYAGVEDNNSNSSSGSSTSSSDVQPLDLSPVKKKPEVVVSSAVAAVKMRLLEDNPLLNQPPLPRSPRPQLLELAAGQPSIPAPSSSSLTLPSTSSPSNSSTLPAGESFPAWKKQRTEPMTPAPSATPSTSGSSHRALPPISILQKPALLLPVSRKTEALNLSSYKHSSWIRETGSTAPTDLSTTQKSGSTNPEFLREQLARLQGQNGRTV